MNKTLLKLVKQNHKMLLDISNALLNGSDYPSQRVLFKDIKKFTK